ncbi:hypothetical protein [Conexibacter sp. SYSU D00693]|uniref:hypothetical protein n=1 Tax=Conexibacter sp. SYSU D00693 TaxID=2812560 RepID=UPI00196A578B|nr:hypothetical protein [Conexibacter sp. SYSU D00693]
MASDARTTHRGAPQEVLPGVLHWSAVHPKLDARVSSYAIPSAGVVVDPMVPDDGLEALSAHGRPQQVVLTSGNHARDAQRVAEAFDVPIRATRPAAERIGDAFEVRVFEDGDEVAPGITAIVLGVLSDDETALHVAVGAGALCIADAFTTYGGTPGFWPDDLLGAHPDRVKAGLKDRLRGLLTREFDALLPAHGDPIASGGKAVLRDFVESPAGHEDFGSTA